MSSSRLAASDFFSVFFFTSTGAADLAGGGEGESLAFLGLSEGDRLGLALNGLFVGSFLDLSRRFILIGGATARPAGEGWRGLRGMPSGVRERLNLRRRGDLERDLELELEDDDRLRGRPVVAGGGGAAIPADAAGARALYRVGDGLAMRRPLSEGYL